MISINNQSTRGWIILRYGYTTGLYWALDSKGEDARESINVRIYGNPAAAQVMCDKFTNENPDNKYVIHRALLNLIVLVE